MKKNAISSLFAVLIFQNFSYGCDKEGSDNSSIKQTAASGFDYESGFGATYTCNNNSFTVKNVSETEITLMCKLDDSSLFPDESLLTFTLNVGGVKYNKGDDLDCYDIREFEKFNTENFEMSIWGNRSNCDIKMSGDTVPPEDKFQVILGYKNNIKFKVSSSIECHEVFVREESILCKSGASSTLFTHGLLPSTEQYEMNDYIFNEGECGFPGNRDGFYQINGIQYYIGNSRGTQCTVYALKTHSTE